MVIIAESVELAAPFPTPSKNTSSDAPGTDTLSRVLEADPQLVTGPASLQLQLAVEQPPTQ